MRSIIIAAALTAITVAALPASAGSFTLSALSADFWSDGKVNAVASSGRVVTDRSLKMIGGWPCTLESPGAGQTARYVELKLGGKVFAMVRYDQPVRDYNRAGQAVKVYFTAGLETSSGWQWSAMGADHEPVNAGISVSDGDDAAPDGCTPFWEE